VREGARREKKRGAGVIGYGALGGVFVSFKGQLMSAKKARWIKTAGERGDA